MVVVVVVVVVVVEVGVELLIKGVVTAVFPGGGHVLRSGIC